MKAGSKIKEIFMSRFERITTSTDESIYPFDAVGVQSAQYLGAQSTDPQASLTLSEDGYVVEIEN